ncbi:MAG TPA: T9SS type A sorting domain-containing protein [Cytophagaceae bacterium]
MTAKQHLLKITLLTLLFATVTTTAKAQNFCFSQATESYTPLTNVTSLTDSLVWDDTSFYVPIGFSFNYKGKIYDSLTVESNGGLYLKDFNKINFDTFMVNGVEVELINDTLPIISAFGEVFNGIDLIDKGYFSGQSKSHIHYTITGFAPDRVFAIEYKNVGFKSLDSVFANDSLNFQIRLYETTNAISFHYGQGMASDSTIWEVIPGAIAGMGELTTLNGQYLDNGFFLTGNPASLVPSTDRGLISGIPASNTVYTFVPSALNTTLSIAANINPVCVKDSILFTATANNAGAAPIYQWTINNVIQGSDSASFNAKGLKHSDTVRCTVIPADLCSGGLPISSNKIIVLQPVLEVAVTVNKDSSCAGDSLFFTAISNLADVSYTWKKNGATVGTNAPIYKDNDFANGDIIYCIVSSSEPCVLNTTATSNSITVKQYKTLVATISISADKTAICSGDSVLFTATAANGGIAPVYEWKVNGILQSEAGTTFKAKGLNNGDKVSCSLIPDVKCASENVNSDTIIISVTTVVSASITIAANKTEICEGTPVTFSASAANAGTTPVYQWMVNGIITGTNSPEFTTSSLINMDEVTCTLNSSQACVANPNITSDKIRMNVNSTPVSFLLTDDNQKTEICPGENLKITVHPFGQGETPIYKWFINSTQININDTIYTASNLKNGDKIFCVMQSSLACKEGKPDTSEVITVTVPAITQASISVEADANPVCATGTVNFAATVANEGNTPSYEWYWNGVKSGTGSSFALTGYKDQDEVYCKLTSDKACVTNNPAISDTVIISVIDVVVSSISITADADTICTGQPIAFTANVTNPGEAPVYQWMLNGDEVGLNSNLYSATNLSDKDSVWCILTTGISCQGDIPESNKIKVAVRSASVASLTISSDKEEVCKGGILTFTADAANAGTDPVYIWSLNNTIVGTNSAVYSGQNFKQGDLITCELVTESKCKATSNSISVTVNPVLAQLDIEADKTTICQGEKVSFTSQTTESASSYSWYVNKTYHTSSGSTFEYANFKDKDTVYCIADFGDNCIDTSNTIIIKVKPFCIQSTEGALTEAGISIAPIPAKDYITVSFNTFDSWEVDLTNQLGEIVRTWNINEDKAILNLDGVPTGVYLMKLRNDSGVYLKKVIIE